MAQVHGLSSEREQLKACMGVNKGWPFPAQRDGAWAHTLPQQLAPLGAARRFAPAARPGAAVLRFLLRSVDALSGALTALRLRSVAANQAGAWRTTHCGST